MPENGYHNHYLSQDIVLPVQNVMKDNVNVVFDHVDTTNNCMNACTHLGLSYEIGRIDFFRTVQY